MARHRPTAGDNVQALLSAAAAVLGAAADTVILVAGTVEIVRPTPPTPLAAGQVPEGMRDYDAAILRALTDRPLSSQQLARRAGHRHNSYFRSRLAAIVEAGHIRHTRRGYVPGG